MKVVLFDGIQEMHVPESLYRALIAREHQVFMTGKITSGADYIEDPATLARVKEEIDKVLYFRPDLIIVFRPSALPPDLLAMLRSSGAKIFAWFSDDPVLWSFTYKYSVDNYDMILHCGNSKVLAYYEEKFRNPTGVNFPFWTDNHSFPYVYASQEPETELVFVGNTNGQVRRQRYYDLASLESSIRIHGHTGPDYFNVSGGYLDSHHELQTVGATAKLAINIPQHFLDYKGMKHWFEGMSKLGFFETPSRAVQCASMGLPIISIEPELDSESSMRSLIRVSSIEQCNKVSKELLQNGDLIELSRKTNIEFQKYFSADSRVLFLEELMENESWRSFTPFERARWFRDFGSSAIEPLSKPLMISELKTENLEVNKSENTEYLSQFSHFGSKKIKSVLIVGERWTRRFSASTVLAVSLEALGYEVTKFDSTRNGKAFSRKDPTELFSGIVDIESFSMHVGKCFDIIIFVDQSFYPSRTDSNIPIIFHAISANKITIQLLKISSIARHLTLLNSSLVSMCRRRGIENTSYVPDIVDNLVLEQKKNYCSDRHSVTVVIQREGHRSLFADIINPLVAQGARVFVAESEENENTSALVRALSSEIVILMPDPSRPGNLGSRFIGHALMLASIVGIYRESTPGFHLRGDRRVFFFNSVQELARKILRLIEINIPLRITGQVVDQYSASSFESKFLGYSETNIENMEE